MSPPRSAGFLPTYEVGVGFMKRGDVDSLCGQALELQKVHLKTIESAKMI
jgi:hypothetical protein